MSGFNVSIFNFSDVAGKITFQYNGVGRLCVLLVVLVSYCVISYGASLVDVVGLLGSSVEMCN